MSRISVLIPVYNVETYLEECLESVISQTEKDIEIICVEDASTDHSLEILKKYQKKDPRIRLICHETNQGTCKARKDAVLAASGEYLMFVDSDDYLALNACEELYRRIRESGADVMQFGTELVSGENVSRELLEWIRNFMEPSTENISGDLLSACFIEGKLNCNLVNKIWRNECCQQAVVYLTDENLITAEDRYMCFLFLYHMSTCAGTKNRYYHYRTGVGITGNDVLSLERFGKRCRGASVIPRVREFLTATDDYEKHKDVYRCFRNDILWDCTDCWYRKLTDDDQPEGFAILLKYWTPGEITGALARTFFEEQEKIERNIKSGNDKRVGIYYRYAGYKAMDSLIKRYADYHTARNRKVILITDSDAPEKGEQYMGYRLTHIPAATDANWNKYQVRSDVLERELKEMDELVYLSPTSHVMIFDRILAEAQGVKVQVAMDEYVLDQVNQKENELQTVKSEYEMMISELKNSNKKLKEQIKHIYETRCGKIMRFIQKKSFLD